MDLVNFQVGSKTVALPILNILLTERFDDDLTDVPNENPSFIGVKDFMNQPVPVFDLGKILNKSSTKTLNLELSSQLLKQKENVFQWLSSLDHAVKSDGNSVTPFNNTEYISWLNQFNCENEDLDSLLQQIKKPMQVAYKAYCEVKQQSNLSVWERDFESATHHLNRLFESASEQVQLSYKPIIVFTTSDGRTPHVGLLVDRVEESIHVEENEIKSLEAVTSVGFDLDAKTKKLMRGLVQLENRHSIIIEPSVLFEK